MLQEVFVRVLRFSPFLKSRHVQIPIRSGAYEHVLTSFRVLKCFVGKQITFFSLHILTKFSLNPTGRLLLHIAVNVIMFALKQGVGEGSMILAHRLWRGMERPYVKKNSITDGRMESVLGRGPTLLRASQCPLSILHVSPFFDLCELNT